MNAFRTLAAAATLGVAAFAAAGVASAQSGWTHAGVSFAPRAGWCTTEKIDDSSDTPCGQEFPIFSVSIAIDDADPIDVAGVRAQSADVLDTAEGKTRVDKIMKHKNSS